MRHARTLRRIAALTTGALALTAAPALAEDVSVKTLHFATTVGPNDDVKCDVVGDIYKPASASKAKPAPAILTTNGFGGSKDDQKTFAMAYAKRGYVVLSYSGLGFGGSGCKITLDDRDFDGKAGSQLVTFLGGGSKAVDGTAVDYVQLDAKGADGKPHANDPRLGMIGGSYGGQIQFAIAGIDPRVDALIPIITWNDLSYSLAPNNTSLARGVTYTTPGVEKFGWVSLFSSLGFANGVQNAGAEPGRLAGCPNFDDRVCAALLQMDATGTPNDTTLSLARHASVTSFAKDIKVPTLLAQGQADTLFNLQESVATYESLKAAGTPTKLVWQSWGHSRSKPAPGELDYDKPESSYEAREFLAWFDHYLKDSPVAPSLDFTFFRDYEPYTGDATRAYGRSASYPAAPPTDLFLSGTDALVADKAKVAAGSSSFVTTAAGAPTSYTETSALDQSAPVTDVPGTTARFTTPPLTEDTDVVGIPSVDLRLAAPAQALAGGAADPAALALFFKLYDLAPDGSITLKNRLISPVRVTNPGVPVHVELPGIVHRFAKGHRIALVVAGGDAAYRGNNVAGPVQVLTDPARPGALHLPIAPAATNGKVVLPSAPPVLSKKQCGSRRAFTVRVQRQFRSKVRSTVVRIDGKQLRKLGAKKSTRISLKGRTRATVTVQLVMTLKSGRKVTDTRRYRVCTRK